MTLMLSFLALPTTQTLAWALVHFLWQGAIVALVAAGVMRWVATSARARYLTGVVALGLIFAAPVATFVILQPQGARSAAAVSAVPLAVDVPLADAGLGAAAAIGTATATTAPPVVLSAMVALWLTGVVCLSVRLLGGWVLARRLAATARRQVDDHVLELAGRVAARLNLTRLVRIAESSSVAVPIVVGWLKPVVLLPAATIAGLAPAHVEALLAHELAHVRRHDYLVNLLQTAVETLLFYHPGVWWLSRRVRVEREHCCDDLAVSICDRVVYVNALTDLATRTTHARLALAATDGSLLGRVRRLLATEAGDRPGAGWPSIGIFVLLAAGLTPAVVALGGDPQAPATLPSPPVAAATASPAAQPRVAMPAGAASTAPRTQEPAASPERSQPRDVEALKRELLAAGSQLEQLRNERLAVDAKRAREESAVRRDAAMANLNARRRDLAEVSSRHEIGLIPQGVVDEIRAQVAAAEREVRLIDVQAETTLMAMGIDAKRVQLEQMYDRLQQEYAAAAARSEAEAARAEQASTFRLNDGGSSTTPTPPAPNAFPVTDPTAQVQAGDILLVDIAGEDLIPRWFVVEAGAIRLPLIGQIKVGALTAEAVRMAVTRALAAGSLAQGKAVTITIYRPR